MSSDPGQHQATPAPAPAAPPGGLPANMPAWHHHPRHYGHAHGADALGPDAVPHGLPWFVRVFYSPALLANIVAFGAAVLLLYTAAVEWPRKTERFYEQLQEQRDAQRDTQSLAKENQRLLMRIETLETQQQVQLQAIQKVLTEMWFRFLAKEKAKEDEGGPPPPP